MTFMPEQTPRKLLPKEEYDALSDEDKQIYDALEDIADDRPVFNISFDTVQLRRYKNSKMKDLRPAICSQSMKGDNDEMQ